MLAYFSKILSPRLRASSTYAREMYAITEAVRRWRQYLLGRRFVIHTDHQSLRSLLHQTIQTPDQYKWLVKLLGFDFDILYKPGCTNKPADALSRLPDDNPTSFLSLAVTRPFPALWHALQQAYKDDSSIASLRESVQHDPEAHPDYILRKDFILYRNRLLIPSNAALQQLLIAEFHNTPVGGQASIRRTYHRLTSTFYCA